MKVNCSTCGKVLERFPCQIKPWKRHFCNRNCRVPPVERFWSWVDKTQSCWIWKGAADEHGYGRFRIGKKLMLAHRYAWEILVGPVPDGKELCHNCPNGDNASCVNPAHLFIATHAENMTDAVNKCRVATEFQLPQCRLSNIQVKEIRSQFKAGVTPKEVAKLFGISGDYARELRRGVKRVHC